MSGNNSLQLKKHILYIVIALFFVGKLSAQQQDTSKVYESNGQSFRFYKVEKGKTLYGISKLFQVSQDDILNMNPEAVSGLKTGMLLKIPKKSSDDNSIKPKSSLSHTVQAKETVYGIAKMHGLTVSELENMNPEIKKGLKAGMVLTLYPAPIRKPIDSEKTKSDSINILTKEKEKGCHELSDKEQRRNIQVTYLLPLFLPATEEFNPKSRIGLDFYSGAKMAIDSLKKLGYNLTVNIFDVQNDSTSLQDIIKNPVLAKSDMIIGPLYSSSFVKIAEFARLKSIPAVSPFSQNDALLNKFPNTIKATPDIISQLQLSGPLLKGAHPGAKFTLIRNTNEKDKELADALKSSLLVSAGISNDQFQEITYSGVNELLTILSEANENVILFPSTVPVQVIDFIGRLSSNRVGRRITLFGLNDWINYENIEFDHLNNLNFTCAASSNTNFYSTTSKAFQATYKDEFKGDPTFYSFQGFDITLFFCEGVAKYGSSFLDCLSEMPKKCGYNSCYKYSRIGNDDGFENQFIYLLEMNNFEMKRKN